MNAAIAAMSATAPPSPNTIVEEPSEPLDVSLVFAELGAVSPDVPAPSVPPLAEEPPAALPPEDDDAPPWAAPLPPAAEDPPLLAELPPLAEEPRFAELPPAELLDLPLPPLLEEVCEEADAAAAALEGAIKSTTIANALNRQSSSRGVRWTLAITPPSIGERVCERKRTPALKTLAVQGSLLQVTIELRPLAIGLGTP